MAGAHDRVETLRLDVTDADRRVARILPEDTIVFHLGMRWFQNGSTLESTLALIQRLAQLRPVTITCAQECEPMAPSLERASGVSWFMKSIPFHQWAAVFERAAVVVTVDTGATHVASAMRRPTVVAFEHRYFRLNSQEWAPYGVPHVLVRKPESPDEASLARFRDDIYNGVAALLHR